MEHLLNQYNREQTVTYKGEVYLVRDNGAVLRHSRPNKRKRQYDDIWTFGKTDNKAGYMYIAQERIHRIVATAFHGEPPTQVHVVDHIDTNRRNNRPENLRWLTRLENALQNPVTVKKIEFLCGSIEAFLKDPSKLRKSSFEKDVSWMRTVTPEEAQACRERMHLWAKTDTQASSGGSLGEWVYKPISPPKKAPQEVYKDRTIRSPSRWTSDAHYYRENAPTAIFDEIILAKTSGAVQKKWRTPTEFPCCPSVDEKTPISTYADKLKAGEIFARNDFSTSVVLNAEVTDDGKSILVMSENSEKSAIKPWTLAEVTYENKQYVHTSHGTFFEEAGAEKALCLALGKEWTGGETFDDFC